MKITNVIGIKLKLNCCFLTLSGTGIKKPLQKAVFLYPGWVQ
jgi:hypothetical protein